MAVLVVALGVTLAVVVAVVVAVVLGPFMYSCSGEIGHLSIGFGFAWVLVVGYCSIKF